jgi:hypothetical protein
LSGTPDRQASARSLKLKLITFTVHKHISPLGCLKYFPYFLHWQMIRLPDYIIPEHCLVRNYNLTIKYKVNMS